MSPHLGQRQVVVLIRGYPGVGKTTLALGVAKELGYCLVCKDDVREPAMRHDARVLADIRKVCPEHAASIHVDSNDMTYEAMFAVGLTQLNVGAKGVVLESPLGRVALGERAVQITRKAQALCVLVDCYAEKSVWEERLAKRTSRDFRPRNADQIVRNYENIEYKIDCDAHVMIDCGNPLEDNVKCVIKIINQLLADETSSS
ncbi:unnamed protein product [Chondrus crispus]|uniref:Uncharacterized protein n=1 Tax=Chondrus crispus TaxID=2769 RepID=R7QR01_CHOCR|nr:unnamed protein product [Chondrus crispus]CDF40539.1 unnamed protein product [Chondrus crispus]|eukprot:XP_005710833.1 unnamed protein product [Chondrus crispus]